VPSPALVVSPPVQPLVVPVKPNAGAVSLASPATAASPPAALRDAIPGREVLRPTAPPPAAYAVPVSRPVALPAREQSVDPTALTAADLALIGLSSPDAR
jgi:hypothetical protein